MITAAALRVMAAKGLTLADVVEIADALEIAAPQLATVDTQAERRRAADRERAKVRRLSAENPQTSADPFPQSEEPASSFNTELNQTPNPPPKVPRPGFGLAKPNGFARFWESYPNKVGKRAAETAFERALRRADAATILAGVERANDRCWSESLGTPPHPTTWLNQDRWLDEPDEGARAPPVTGGMLAAASDEMAFRMAVEGAGNERSARNSFGDQGVVVALSASSAQPGRSAALVRGLR